MNAFSTTLMVCLALASFVLLLALVRAGRRKNDLALDMEALIREMPPTELYRPMARLFRREDSIFLKQQKGYLPAMSRRLCRERRRVLALYLQRIRDDFGQVWAVCRLLAPMSPTPEFGTLILRQYVAFHLVYWNLLVRCKLGVAMGSGVDTVRLVSPLQELQMRANRALQSLERDLYSVSAAH